MQSGKQDGVRSEAKAKISIGMISHRCCAKVHGNCLELGLPKEL